jgi:hypothetical protein
MHKHVDQASQDCSSIIGSPIGSLAEKVGQDWHPATGLLEFFDHPTQEHGFAFAGVALDPENRVVLGTAPLLKLGTLQSLAVCILEQTTFGLLNALLIVARITKADVAYTDVPSLNRFFEPSNCPSGSFAVSDRHIYVEDAKHGVCSILRTARFTRLGPSETLLSTESWQCVSLER